MTIFYRIYKLFKSMGLILLLICTSYIVTSVIFYSRNQKAEESKEIKIIEDQKIQVIDKKRKEYIYLDIKINGKVSDLYLIAYALSYKDRYKENIHLYVVDEKIVINTGETGIFVLKI